MADPVEQIPQELKEIWDGLVAEFHKSKFEINIHALQKSVTSTNNLVKSTSSLSQSPSPESILEARKDLVSTIQQHSLALSTLQPVFSHFSEEAKGLVSKVLDWIIRNFVDVLSKFSSQLNVENWAVELTGGLPMGWSLSLTITFK